MTTREIFRKISESGQDERLVLATVICGEKQGEKELFTVDQVPDIPNGRMIEYEGNRIFYESLRRQDDLVICGAGHVSIPIIKIGKELGFRILVIEDRPKFADDARRAGADRVICEDFAKAMADIKGSCDTYFVIVTRGHRYDMDCLRCVLAKKNAYVGMMGSKRRVAMVKQELEQEGFSNEVLSQVHAPIGLPIGAQSPEEIAVSVAAELIQERHRINGKGETDPEILDRICKDKRKCVLSTIVSKRGSAPRGVGTRMLVYEDGSIVGTIGGGCMESRLIQKSLNMLRFGTPLYQLQSVDMTETEAEDAGMVCGGMVEVFMEIL